MEAIPFSETLALIIPARCHISEYSIIYNHCRKSQILRSNATSPITQCFFDFFILLYIFRLSPTVNSLPRQNRQTVSGDQTTRIQAGNWTKYVTVGFFLQLRKETGQSVLILKLPLTVLLLYSTTRGCPLPEWPLITVHDAISEQLSTGLQM
jgi:hypothetical protein